MWNWPIFLNKCFNNFFLAKDAEKKINDDFKACRAAFINCSKLEDDALEYMVKCYTSAGLIKTNLKELLQIKDSCAKLQKNLEAKINTTASERSVKKQRISDSITCSTYLLQVTAVNNVSICLSEKYSIYIHYIDSSKIQS